MATVYPFRQPAAALRGAAAKHGPSRFLDPPYSTPLTSAPDDTLQLPHGLPAVGFERRLGQFEAAAQEKFCQAIDGLPHMKLDGWFIRQLDHKIIPALTRIGFDECFARLLFQAAGGSWQRMGPWTDKCIRVYPDLIKNLNAVREEMNLTTGSRSANCWIILPRIYHFLEQEHAACLLCYLSCLAGEPATEFRRILTRIVIEFIGNYALKYRRMFPGCRMDAALFYGYTAMFWKNLRNPPQGFEDDLIFNHCLRWIKLFPGKCADLDDDMSREIGPMEAYRQQVMLMGPAWHSTADGNHNLDLEKFFVTLRHGRPGRAAAVEFMRNGLYSCGKDAADLSIYARLPTAMNRLLHSVKRKLPAEPPEVQKVVRSFLHGLKENLASGGSDEIGSLSKPPEQFRFVVRRVLGLVEEMTALPA